MYKFTSDNSEEIYPSKTSVADLAAAWLETFASDDHIIDTHNKIVVEYRFELSWFKQYTEYRFGDGSKLLIQKV
jgi:hypothetical protein